MTKFLNELVKQGGAGGDEAAKLLKRAVFDYLRYDEYFKHDHRIVIRVYANLRGLSKTYADKGILPNTAAFSDFVRGFNKAHPLFDFIDAGNHKEAADTKLKGGLFQTRLCKSWLIFPSRKPPSVLTQRPLQTDHLWRIGRQWLCILPELIIHRHGCLVPHQNPEGSPFLLRIPKHHHQTQVDRVQKRVSE